MLDFEGSFPRLPYDISAYIQSQGHLGTGEAGKCLLGVHVLS